MPVLQHPRVDCFRYAPAPLKREGGGNKPRSLALRAGACSINFNSRTVNLSKVYRIGNRIAITAANYLFSCFIKFFIHAKNFSSTQYKQFEFIHATEFFKYAQSLTLNLYSFCTFDQQVTCIIHHFCMIFFEQLFCKKLTCLLIKTFSINTIVAKYSALFF